MTATIYNVKGRGLVVLTSCSHRGVINTVRAAMSAFGGKADIEI
jgi:7,8-dihydropterin-6-yl-methyl-4-(beta-D-ribofuranosyl)aminobenzene 5'-phosphate synthase